MISPDAPWYRQPLAWLVLSPPLAAVAGGVFAIYLIITHPDADVRTAHPGAPVIHGHAAGSLVPPGD